MKAWNRSLPQSDRCFHPYRALPSRVQYKLDDQLRGGPLLTHGAAGVATVAGKFDGLSSIFTILATVFRVLGNPAIARRMLTFLRLFTHAKVSINRDCHLAFQAQEISRTLRASDGCDSEDSFYT